MNLYILKFQSGTFINNIVRKSAFRANPQNILASKMVLDKHFPDKTQFQVFQIDDFIIEI